MSKTQISAARCPVCNTKLNCAEMEICLAKQLELEDLERDAEREKELNEE